MENLGRNRIPATWAPKLAARVTLMHRLTFFQGAGGGGGRGGAVVCVSFNDYPSCR